MPRRDNRCRHLASARANRNRVGRQGGQRDGVEHLTAGDGKTVLRVGTPLSGSSAHERPPTYDETLRALESDFKHVQKKLRAIKENPNG